MTDTNSAVISGYTGLGEMVQACIQVHIKATSGPEGSQRVCFPMSLPLVADSSAIVWVAEVLFPFDVVVC